MTAFNLIDNYPNDEELLVTPEATRAPEDKADLVKMTQEGEKEESNTAPSATVSVNCFSTVPFPPLDEEQLLTTPEAKRAPEDEADLVKMTREAPPATVSVNSSAVSLGSGSSNELTVDDISKFVDSREHHLEDVYR